MVANRQTSSPGWASFHRKERAESVTGGGGSGGSVLVETTNVTGHGEINVNGGDGHSNGGAGAGGRIGVHVDFQNNFGGM